MRLAILLVICGAALTACGPKRIAVPEPSPSTTVVLLRDESGMVGRAHISTPSGSAELTADRETIRVVETMPPDPVTTLTEEDVILTFGTVLSALPPSPLRFTLYFRFESDDLTDESASKVPEILQAVAQRAVPEVVVIGHTDTMGAVDANLELGLNRAMTISDFLETAGLDGTSIEATSHGESNLQLQTADEIREPLNRRVEIVVR